MKRTLIILLTASLLISLFFFIRATDLKMVFNLMEKIGYRFLLLLLITFIAYLLGTLSWRFTLGQYSRSVSIGRLFLIRHLGETIGMFNPASVIGGDAMKALILEEQQIPRDVVVWSMFLSRGIMVLSQLLLFLSTALAVFFQNPELYPAFTNEKQSGLYPFLLAHWRTFRLKSAATISELPAMLRAHKRMLLISSGLALLHWVFGGLEFYFILKFLGLKVTILQALAVDLGVVLFKSAGAFIPAQIGIEEYGNKIMLMAIGISAPQIWITASVLRRARQLVWVGFGIAIYFILFKKSKHLNPAKDGNTVYQS